MGACTNFRFMKIIDIARSSVFDTFRSCIAIYGREQCTYSVHIGYRLFNIENRIFLNQVLFSSSSNQYLYNSSMFFVGRSIPLFLHFS